MSKTKAQLEEENEAQRDMLAALRQEIEALYDIFAAVGESRARSEWIVGYAGGIKSEKPSLLRKYATVIRAKDAPPEPPVTPDPEACTCGHLPSEHLYHRPSPCTKCGCKEFIAAAAAKDGPLSVDCPSCGAPAGQYCTSAFGCTARAYRAYGEPDSPSPAAIVAKAIETGMTVAVEDDAPAGEWARRFGPYCTAGHEPVPGLNLLCELKPGHDGPHRSIGYRDGDPDITWTDAPLCDSALPLTHGGELKCTLDDGHYGAHSALTVTGKRRWLGTGADARNEDGTHAAPEASRS